MKQEKHHSIPLAIWGTTIPDNIILLDSWTHKLVHQTLNIPYKTIRQYREMINNVVLLNEEIAYKELDMKLKYFSKAKQLDKEVFKLHYNSIIKQSWQTPKELITYNKGQNEIEEALYNMYKKKVEEILLINSYIEKWKTK